MVTCKSKNVYFAMDKTSTYQKDMQIMSNIQKKLENAGFTVHRIDEPEHGSDNGYGPNAMANQYSYLWRKGIKNSIVFNLMNGVDPSNILEAYQSDKSRGDGFWYSQRSLKPLGNVAVLGWFYGSYDPVNEENKDKSWTCWYTVRASETHGRIYNPRQLMDNNGVLCICDHNDYNGDSIANLFIKLVKENMGESDSDNSDSSEDTQDNPDNSQDTVTPSVNTNKTLSEQVITQIYTNPYYQDVITAKTDSNGAFTVPVNLPTPGKYIVNLNFAGSKYHNGSTATVNLENYSGKVFNRELLQTTTVSKYTDGTTDTTVTGSIGGEKHLYTVIRTRTYQDGLLKEEKTETSTSDGIDTIIAPASTTVKPSDVIDDGTRQSPFTNSITPNTDGSPNVSSMKHNDKTFAMVNTSKSYTLTKEQYKEVFNRDSKMVQLHNYVESKYTAFLSEETPNTYQVLKREQWNPVEESIYYYLVKGNGLKGDKHVNYAWPDKIKIDFANHKTIINGSTINWKAGECTYWFVADNQDLKYTCGPTACSVCTQILHHYHSETLLQGKIGAIAGDGSAPSAHVSALRSVGFTAEIYSGFSNAVNWVKANKPCVYHTYDHYTTLCDVADDGKILYSNSVQSDGKYGPLTGWRSSSTVKNKYWGSAVKVGLNWTISEEEKASLNNFYSSMGGAWAKPANTGESLRMFYLTYS